MCNLPQFAQNPQGISTVLPCYCIGFHVLLWKVCATILFVVLVPRLGGWGTKIFLDLGFIEGCCIRQPVALKVLHWNLLSVVPHARTGPSVDSPSKSQWGSILLLVRALVPCSTPLLYWALSA